ncbi:hypothetical protein D3C76_1660540 [compost metagenome]
MYGADKTITQLAPQMMDMDLNRVTAHVVIPVIQFFLDQRPCQHTPLVVQKQFQHRQFARGQRHGLTVAAHAAGCGIKHQVAVDQLRRQLPMAAADQRL